MILSGHHSFSPGAWAPILIVMVCLALAIQGAHVCPPGESSGLGVRAVIAVASPVCPACALAQSVLITVLLVFFSLVPTGSRTLLVSVQVRSFRRGLRLDMRAPPAL